MKTPRLAVRPVPARLALSPVPAWTALRPVPARSTLCSTPGDTGLGWASAPVSLRVSLSHLVVAAVVTLVVIAGLGWLGHPHVGIPAETTIVRVGAGETVWDVARRVAPGSDPHGVVERIRQLNGMVSSAVQPGQQLRVPDGR